MCYGDNQNTLVEKSTNDYISGFSLTMKKERQNEQNFTVKEKINCRKANANSLIDLRIDDNFCIIIDIVRGSARSCLNDSTYFQTTLASIDACRGKKILDRMSPFGLEKGPRKPRRARLGIKCPKMGRELVI